jgi:hypothetical protein
MIENIKESIKAVNNCDTIISINQIVDMDFASLYQVNMLHTSVNSSHYIRYRRKLKTKRILNKIYKTNE